MPVPARWETAVSYSLDVTQQRLVSPWDTSKCQPNHQTFWVGPSFRQYCLDGEGRAQHHVAIWPHLMKPQKLQMPWGDAILPVVLSKPFNAEPQQADANTTKGKRNPTAAVPCASDFSDFLVPTAYGRAFICALELVRGREEDKTQVKHGDRASAGAQTRCCSLFCDYSAESWK